MQRLLCSFLFAATAMACGSKSTPPPAKPEMKTEAPPPTPAEPAEPVAAEKPAPSAPEPPPPPAPKHATATMAPTKKNKVKGTIELKDVDGGVEVTANLEGLKPGKHGFHIHEKGDCSDPEAKSAGGHFNPGGHKHGAPDAAEHHEGDLGNIVADKKGKATTTVTVKGVTLGDGDTSIAGKAFIIHDKADDLKSQPVGNAGARVACGVINVE